MEKIYLKRENLIALIVEDNDSIEMGRALERLLETERDYSIKGFDVREVCFGSESFESPVLFLYDEREKKNAVCIVKKDNSGRAVYKMYGF